MDITPIQNDRGEVVRFISIQRDITQRKETEEALRQAKEAADAANRAKSEFLASMSHEIRTPMNAIIGMAELLDETPLNPEQRKFVDVFRSAGENLLNIINDILDLSKVEAGQITLENIDFDLRELVEKVCEVMALRAHEKGIELACRHHAGSAGPSGRRPRAVAPGAHQSGGQCHQIHRTGRSCPGSRVGRPGSRGERRNLSTKHPAIFR